MSDPGEVCTPIHPDLLELLESLRAPIKLEPVSPQSSPNPLFDPSMSRLKSTAVRGRGRSHSVNPREDSAKVNTKNTAHSRGGHRAGSAGVPQSSKSSAHIPSTPDSPSEDHLLHAIPMPGPRPKVQWHQCHPSTLTARTINKYIRDFGLPEDSTEWVAPAQRANMLGGVYSVWSRYNIRAGQLFLCLRTSGEWQTILISALFK